MGNRVDFKRCESLDSRRQTLTEAERERLEELLGARAAVQRAGKGARRNRAASNTQKSCGE
ncbi:hypothetical protein GCM10009780_14780 [Actinomadura alba]